MKYKVGDLVYFEDYDQKGVGKVVVMDNSPKPYLVHSTDIVGGHDNGESMEAKQDNSDNWWFREDGLKPFTDTDDPLSEVEFYEDTPSVEEKRGTQIKIFSVTYDSDEEKLNKFIKDKEIIDIKMSAYEDMHSNTTTKYVLVIYKDIYSE